MENSLILLISLLISLISIILSCFLLKKANKSLNQDAPTYSKIYGYPALLLLCFAIFNAQLITEDQYSNILEVISALYNIYK